MIIRSLLMHAILLAILSTAYSYHNLLLLSEEFNIFSFKFFKNLPTGLKENVVICPFSIVSILNSLYYGSRNETAKDLRNLLSPYSVKRTREEYLSLAEGVALTVKTGMEKKSYVFNTSNAILFNSNSNLNVLPNYKDEVERMFMVISMTVDLNASPKEILNFVNPWVTSRTPKIRYYNPDIDSTADLIVLSGAYFKAPWQNAFSPFRTIPRIFYNKGLESRMKFVPMMHMTNNLMFFNNSMLCVIELPFVHAHASMFIYLPNTLNGLEEMEADFQTIFFETFFRMSRQFIAVSLPKFQLSYSTLLSPSLLMMGTREIFKPFSIDLSRMVDKQKVIIGEMNHKAFLSFTEWGLDVEGDLFREVHSPKENTPFIRVNHPFLFVIIDSRDNILFMGRVQEL